LVVAGGVDGELAESFSGGGVEDGDVEVADGHQNAGSGVGASDSDVVQASGQAQGDAPGVVDAVGAHAVVAVGAIAGAGFGAGGVGGDRGGAVGQRTVRAAVVVFVDEDVESGLQFGDGGGAGLAGEPAFEGLVESSTLPQVVGWLGVALIWVMPRLCSSASKALRPPLPPESRVVKTMPLSVRVDAGTPWGGNGFTKFIENYGSGDATVGGDR
jgi:hypothetical protein